MGMDQEKTVLSLLSSPCQSPSTCNLKIEKKTFQGPSVWNNPPTWKMLYYENKKIRFQINKSKNVMEIYMSGLTPSPLPHMMEFFFPILLDIRPFLRTLWKIFILPSEMPKLVKKSQPRTSNFSILVWGVKPDIEISITTLTLCSLDFETVELKFKTIVW